MAAGPFCNIWRNIKNMFYSPVKENNCHITVILHVDVQNKVGEELNKFCTSPSKHQKTLHSN